jgi:hypothetical protein
MVTLYWDVHTHTYIYVYVYVYIYIYMCVCVCVINSTTGMNPRKPFFLLILYSLEHLLVIVSPNSVS